MQKGRRHKSGRPTLGEQPLRRFTIAISGYFGEERSVERIRKWIHANGGTVAHDVSPEVTHLVCSKKHFKKDVAMGMARCALRPRRSVLMRESSLVDKARRLRTVKIVSWDWLEDTLMKGRPIEESAYLMAPLVKRAEDAKEKRKAVRRENIEKGSEWPSLDVCRGRIS